MAGRNRINEVGNRYNQLTVLNFSGNRTKGGSALWECKCDCGNVRLVDGRRLRNGMTKSCGCLRKIDKYKASFNAVYSGYLKSASKRGHEFALTKDDFKDITQQNCHYCNSIPSKVHCEKTNHYNGHYKYNGIDRMNPSIGYIKSNCVPCCWRCNKAKGMMDYLEYLDFINISYNTLKMKKI